MIRRPPGAIIILGPVVRVAEHVNECNSIRIRLRISSPNPQLIYRPPPSCNSATETMSHFTNTVTGAGAKAAVLKKNPDDVVIVAATRTALTKVSTAS